MCTGEALLRSVGNSPSQPKISATRLSSILAPTFREICFLKNFSSNKANCPWRSVFHIVNKLSMRQTFLDAAKRRDDDLGVGEYVRLHIGKQ